MFARHINILKSNSFFLFGARATGKSTLLQATFEPDEALLINLLDSELFNRLTSHPDGLVEMVNVASKEWCIIDEVQRIPQLLDTVHSIMESKRTKFALTGSSARKLKRGNANMLGGRAFLYKLFPLTHLELADQFNLDQVLNYGSLAKITEYDTPREKIHFLKSYAETYLKEEVLIEQLIRSLPPFRRFLDIAALQDTELVSFANIGRDINTDPKNVANYYSILEDTLLGFFLESYHTSVRKRQKKAPKFYWFDTGVRRALAGSLDTPVTAKSFEYGSLFESFVVNEIHRLLVYAERSFRLSYLRVDDTSEIDLVLERTGLPTYLIEIKSTRFVNENHICVISRYQKEIPHSIAILLSNDPHSKRIANTLCMYWQTGLKEIGIELPDL